MKKVLIVEDDAFLAQAYKVKLAKEDMEVKVASDGEEAMAILRDFLPDVILLDLMLPHKDGFSVLQDLHSDAVYSKIPVVVASNLGQKEDIEKSLSLGATDVVIKSETSLTDLVIKINTILEHTH